MQIIFHFDRILTGAGIKLIIKKPFISDFQFPFN